MRKLLLFSFIYVFFTITYFVFGNSYLTKAEATVPSPVYLAPCPSCSVTPTVYQASPSNAPVSTNPQPSTTSSYPTTSQLILQHHKVPILHQAPVKPHNYQSIPKAVDRYKLMTGVIEEAVEVTEGINGMHQQAMVTYNK